MVEGFDSKQLSLELQSLEALSFTQLTGSLIQDSEVRVPVTFSECQMFYCIECLQAPADCGNAGDRESKISQRSLSNDAIALHDSIDHFTQAFGSDSTSDAANDGMIGEEASNTNAQQESRRSNEYSWEYPRSTPGEDELVPGGDNDSDADSDKDLDPVLVELEEGIAGAVSDTNAYTENRNISLGMWSSYKYGAYAVA